MQTPPPPPPASLPPPKRRFGRRLNRVPAIIFIVTACIIAASITYTLYLRGEDERRARQLIHAAPSAADATSITKDAPSGYIPPAKPAAFRFPAMINAEAPTPAANKEEPAKRADVEDDIGLEKARKAAWGRYWAEYEEVHKQRFEKRKEALTNLKTSVEASSAPPGGHGGGEAGAGAPPAPTPISASPGASNGMGSWWGAGSGGGGLPGLGGFYPGLGPTPQIDREGQEQKLTFAGQQGDLGKNDTVPTVHKPPNPYAVMAGTYVKVKSENAINSDVPGSALGRVSESVYNTSDGRCVMIPQGSKIIGHYNSVVSAGQTRLPGVMTRIIFPDGSSQAIGAMEAADNAGSAGWEDQVNRHLLLKFGSAAVAGMFGAAIQLSVPQHNGFNNGYDAQQIIGASIGQQMGQLGQQLTQQNLSIPNTLTIRAGYEYTIIFDKDVIMQPWSCGGTRRASLLPIMSMQ